MSRPSRRPLDRDLYDAVVAEAKSRFDVWPSAYASGWVVKTYKERGGRYAGGDRKTRSGLTKWFGESWVDLSRPIHDEDGELVGYEPCGRKASDDPAAYPKCRPLAEAMRMSPSEVKDAIKRKRAAEAKASKGRGGRGARAPVRVSTYRKNPDVTSTQAFRRWFGDSKVVDENGEPLVVYHGTDKSFDVFKTSSRSVNSTTFGPVETERSGIFVSDNPEFSREFGSRLLTLYVRIENPAEINRDTVLDFAETIDPFTERDLWLLARHVARPWALFDGQLGPRFIAYLQELGHDGATFIEDVPKGDDVGEDEQEYVEGRTYVVFDPRQIKSATENDGTFDLDDADLRSNPAHEPVVVLYHRTTPANAAKIVRERRWVSREQPPFVFFSTDPHGHGTSYGEALLEVVVPEDVARLDDEFPSGEQHYAVLTRDLAGLPVRLVEARANPYDPEDVYGPVVATDELEDGTVVEYVAVPFPVERKPLGHNDDPKVQGTVRLDELIATQRRVTKVGVQKYALGEDDRDPPRPGSARMPAILVYETSDGRQYIADGHHRAFAAWLRGLETFPAIIQLVRE